MSIYYDPNDSFLLEMSEWFIKNPITSEELRLEIGKEKIPFLNRYIIAEATEEQEKKRRENLSKSLKSKTPHPNSLKNLEKNDYWKGKKQSPEMIAKRMKNMYGRTVSEETRQKISDKAKNYKHMLGKKHSEETIAKMKATAKLKWNKR